MSDLPVVFIDLETTGLIPTVDGVPHHEILELAAEWYTSIDDFTLRGSFCYKIKPRRMHLAHPRALEINGYTEELWEHAVDLPDALADFASWLPEGPVILAGHVVHFDLGFLQAAHKECGLPLPPFERHRIDTATLAHPLRVRRIVPNVRLVTLAAHFGLPTDAAHTAAGDVRMTVEVYRRLVA